MGNNYQVTGSLHLSSGSGLKKQQQQQQNKFWEKRLHSVASSSNSVETAFWGLTEVREEQKKTDLGAYSDISLDNGYQVIEVWTVGRAGSIVTTAFYSVLRIWGFQGPVKEPRVI